MGTFEFLIFLGFIVSTLVFGIMAFIKRDYAFIVDHPFDFFMELLFISIIPALLMVFIFARTRNMSKDETILSFFTIIIKFMVLHILLQLSGLYTSMFGPSR